VRSPKEQWAEALDGGLPACTSLARMLTKTAAEKRAENAYFEAPE